MKFFLLKYVVSIAVLFSVFNISALGGDIKCPPKQDANRTFWECPELKDNVNEKNKFFAKLDNISYVTGAYVCQYTHEVGGEPFQSCNYKSSSFVKHKQRITDTLMGKIEKGNSSSGQLSYEAQRAESSPEDIDFAKIFNHRTPHMASIPLENLEDKFNEVNEKLFKLWKDSNGSVIHRALTNIKNITHRHLVEPYTNPSSITERKGTFSNFVAGLVVLNPEMIEGFIPASGELKISAFQKNLATKVGADTSDLALNDVSLGAKAERFYDQVAGAVVGVSDAAKVNSERMEKEKEVSSLKQATSWLTIFKDKLWGYYYNLHRRLDVGFDIISTKFLFLMAVIFMFILGTKSGVGHLINKDHGHQNSERNWMKALALMLGIGIFFISLPTPETSGSDNGGYEMRKNQTIVKGVIRFSVDQGANFATMVSDLGLDAFLNYVVKKQNITSANEHRDYLHGQLLSLTGYYPAFETLMECKEYYKAGLKDFSVGDRTIGNRVDNAWFTSAASRYSDMKIRGISMSACVQAEKVVNGRPGELFSAILETDASITDLSETIAVGTEHLVKNHIAVSDRIGWVSAFMTPLSYLLLKNADVYLSKGIDTDKIEETVDKQLENWGVRTGINFDEVEGWQEKAGLGLNKVSDNLQFGAAYMASIGGHALMWNILPGYSSMRQGFESYFQNMYRAKLDLYISSKKKNDTKSLMKSIKTIGKGFSRGGLGLAWALVQRALASVMHVSNVGTWQTIIFMISSIAAILSWQLMFTTFFISSISLLLLLKTVLYFKDLMIHFIISPFIALWAFSQAGAGGEKKIWNYLRDTLVLAIYPTLIVLGGFVFIFIYELLNLLYAYLMELVLGLEKANIALMSQANTNTNTFTAYLNIMGLETLSGILRDIIGLFIALITIMKFPEYVLRKFGINDQETLMVSQTTNEVHTRTERISNPLAG